VTQSSRRSEVQRRLRGRLPAGDLDRAAAHRPPPRSRSGQGKAPTPLRTRHRKGQRSSPLRADLTRRSPPSSGSIAPWREWELKLPHRADRVRKAARHRGAGDGGAPLQHRPEPLSHLLRGRCPRGPWAEPPAKMFQLTNDPEAAPDVPVTLEIAFERGDPVMVDGERLGPVALLTRLNRPRTSEHGIGRVDLVENRFVGNEVTGRLRDARRHDPARGATALESLTLDRECSTARLAVPPRGEIYYGSGSRRASAAPVSRGRVRRDVNRERAAQALQGTVMVTGRRSPRSFRTDFATSRPIRSTGQRDAEGFINLNALRLKIRALRDRTS